jgi:hypothetical protein
MPPFSRLKRKQSRLPKKKQPNFPSGSSTYVLDLLFKLVDGDRMFL